MALKLLKIDFFQVNVQADCLDKEKYDLREVSKLSGRDIKDLREEAKIGDIQAVKEKGKWLFFKDDLLEAFLLGDRFIHYDGKDHYGYIAIPWDLPLRVDITKLPNIMRVVKKKLFFDGK